MYFFFFNSTIEDHFKNRAKLILFEFLTMASIKAVAVFLGHPVCFEIFLASELF